MRTVSFIVNPISGGKDKSSILAAIGRYMDLSQCRYHVRQTTCAGEAETLARDSKADIVVAVGGDGTVSEVAKGLIGTEKALGIIPCGSGDGLALHLGISREPAKAVKVINDACIQKIDVAHIDGKPFFVTAGVGLDALVSWDFASSKKRGLGTYIQTALESWIWERPEHYLVECGDKTWSGDAVFVTVGNANQWGNEAKITPGASLTDGLLDVTIVEPFDALEIPDMAARLMTGRMETYKRVHTFRGTQVHIRRIAPGPAHKDGDPFQAGKDLYLDVQPGALNVIVPRNKLGKV